MNVFQVGVFKKFQHLNYIPYSFLFMIAAFHHTMRFGCCEELQTLTWLDRASFVKVCSLVYQTIFTIKTGKKQTNPQTKHQQFSSNSPTKATITKLMC